MNNNLLRDVQLNIVKLPIMKIGEIDQLIREQFLCRIAFQAKDGPYIAPFQYVVMDNHLYFHFTDYGNKINFLKEENQVCVEVEKYTPDLSEYAFVSLTGTLKVVVDEEERQRAVEKLGQAGGERLSPNFLHAHGLKSQDGWQAFRTKKSLMIIKLEKVTSKKGLKSP